MTSTLTAVPVELLDRVTPVMDVDEFEEMSNCTPPIVTWMRPLKFAPEMTTVWPPAAGPLDGEMPETVGTGGAVPVTVAVLAGLDWLPVVTMNFITAFVVMFVPVTAVILVPDTISVTAVADDPVPDVP